MKNILLLILSTFLLVANTFAAVDYNELRRIVINENDQELDFFLSEVEYRGEEIDFNRALNDNGDTIATLAAWNNKPSVLRVIERYSFLSSSGINYDQVTKNGSSAVSLAVYTGCIKCLRYFEDANASFTNIGPSRNDALHIASYTPKIGSKDRFELVKYLIDNKLANMRYRDSNGSNALLRTLARGEEYSEHIALLLIENRMNPNVRNKYKDTPLHWASSRNYVQVVSDLIEAGAYVDIKNTSGSTPLSLAVFNNHSEVVRVLVEEGDVDVDLRGANEDVPIVVAANNNSRVIVELLAPKSGWTTSAQNILAEKEKTVALIQELMELSNQAFKNTEGTDLWDIGVASRYNTKQLYNTSSKIGFEVKDAKSKKVCGYDETIEADFRTFRPFEEVSVPSHVGVVGLKFTAINTVFTGSDGISRSLSFIMPFKSIVEKNKWIETFDKIHHMFKENDNFGNGEYVEPSSSGVGCGY
ncbi:ankyrin repeat domain-containing protein [Halobacteriovorax sp. CON-3]|uniref:ankyrin repeat domain-containing protein n=1 Tax=Halobacteriovorax sp. CON-3 TaxID=3157710 RepID=UPI003710E9A6